MIQWTGIVTLDKVVTDKIDLHIKPFPDDLIEDGALEANHLTREDLFAEHRLDPLDAHKKLLDFCGKHVDKYTKTDKFFWIGYNAKFDLDFTWEWFRKCGDIYCGSWFWAPPLCVMVLAGYLLQRNRAKLPDFKLRTLWEYLHPQRIKEFDEKQWHDALFDIERTIEVEEALRGVLHTHREPQWKPQVLKRLNELRVLLPPGEDRDGLDHLIASVSR